MCGPMCAAPEEVDMTCDACTMGIKVSHHHHQHYARAYNVINKLMEESGKLKISSSMKPHKPNI